MARHDFCKLPGTDVLGSIKLTRSILSMLKETNQKIERLEQENQLLRQKIIELERVLKLGNQPNLLMNKREINAKFKRLLNIPNGLTSSMKYAKLKIAKEFAIANNLEFPANSQLEYVRVGREYMYLCIDYELGKGVFYVDAERICLPINTYC